MRENSSSLRTDVFQWETLLLVNILLMTRFYVQSFLRKEICLWNWEEIKKKAQALQWTILNSWDKKEAFHTKWCSSCKSYRFSHARSHIHADDRTKPTHTVMASLWQLALVPPQDPASVNMVCASYFTLFQCGHLASVAWLPLTWPLVFWREHAVPTWNVCLSPNLPVV